MQRANDARMMVSPRSVSEIDKLRNLLVNLDTPSGEVLVKAVVYEVRNDTRETNAVSLAIGLLKSLNGVGISLGGSVDSGNAIKIRSSNICRIPDDSIRANERISAGGCQDSHGHIL
jgi:type II secretory pathway component GspD/PulD (secretin)